jgi:hypothetical protein
MNIVMSGGGRLTTAQLYDLGIEQVQVGLRQPFHFLHELQRQQL